MDIHYKNTIYAAITEDEATRAGIPSAIIAAAKAEAAAARDREALRHRIATTAGDTPALLGTTADATLLLLVEVGRLTAALAQVSSLAEMRDGAAPLAELLAPLVSAGDAGATTYEAKGASAADVVAEVLDRTAAVSSAFKEV